MNLFLKTRLKTVEFCTIMSQETVVFSALLFCLFGDIAYDVNNSTFSLEVNRTSVQLKKNAISHGWKLAWELSRNEHWEIITGAVCTALNEFFRFITG